MINSAFNKDLLEEIRLYYGTLILNGNQFEIVPEELTHDYLFNNFKIPNVIKEYYYLPCVDMFTNKDYEYFVSTGYNGNPKTTLKPYPFSFNGAFIPRKQLYFRLDHLIHKVENYQGKPIKSFENLFPYFKDYSEGFKNGYECFEDDCIKKFLPTFADKSDFINKTFEYISKHIIFSHSWRNNHSGFKISRIFNDNKILDCGEIIEAFEDGRYQGYFYKAWSLILSNSNLFEDLFHEFLEPAKTEFKLVDDLLNAAHTMQQNRYFWSADEDTKTRQLLDLLPSKYQTKDQSKYGKSFVGKRAGSVDAVIKIDGTESFVEAFNLKNFSRQIIKTHIEKLEINYDSKGLKEKFICVYYNLQVNMFESVVKKYLNYIQNEHKFIYPLSKEIEEIKVKYTDSRLFKTYHVREGHEVVLYHLLLKFPK